MVALYEYACAVSLPEGTRGVAPVPFPDEEVGANLSFPSVLLLRLCIALSDDEDALSGSLGTRAGV